MFWGLGQEYGKLWLAAAISYLGDGINRAAAPLLAAALTQDPLLVAGLAFAYELPLLLFPLFTGVLVDRFDRRRIMAYADIFRTAVMGFLGLATLFGFASLPLLYATFFVLGTVETLFDNSSQAVIPAVVAPNQLEKANGRVYSAEIVGNEFAGPPLGGLLFAFAASIPFLLNAGSFAASAALLFAMRGSFKAQISESEGPRTLLSDIKDGIRWLGQHRLILTLAAMSGTINLLLMAKDAIFVLFAREILNLGGFGYGLLITASAVGGLLGSFVADRVVRILGSGRALYSLILLQAAAFAMIAAFPSPLVVAVMQVLAAVAVVVFNVVAVSLRQAVVPTTMFGRVNGAYRMIAFGGGAVGALVGGLIAKQFGLSAPFWFAAAMLILVVVLASPFVNSRTIDRARTEA